MCIKKNHILNYEMLFVISTSFNSMIAYFELTLFGMYKNHILNYEMLSVIFISLELTLK